LEFYDVLVRHDCNQPLPFDDHAFKTVYCNAAYWIDNIDGFLNELRRITQPNGRVVLQVKLDAMARYTLAAYQDQLGPRVLEIIGRDRLDCWQSLADRGTWENRFAKAGLLVERETPFITATHAHIWDIGLRPIAPLLTKLANGVRAPTRDAVKTEWVDLFVNLATPLCDAHFNLFDGKSEPAEIQYELRPQ
ncbi:MAG: methyltransferase domain-containing protein, partial [Planctomycetes bacterium]|nr:methyltransferase domain-containing protein [Planctomycetota bacterium]